MACSIWLSIWNFILCIQYIKNLVGIRYLVFNIPYAIFCMSYWVFPFILSDISYPVFVFSYPIYDTIYLCILYFYSIFGILNLVSLFCTYDLELTFVCIVWILRITILYIIFEKLNLAPRNTHLYVIVTYI